MRFTTRIKTSSIDNIPQETFNDVASKTVGAVEFVRDKLEELFLWSRKTVDPKITVPEKDKAEYDPSRGTTPIKFQFCSDSILAYVALRATGYQWNDLFAVRDILISVGETLLMTLAMDSYPLSRLLYSSKNCRKVGSPGTRTTSTRSTASSEAAACASS